MRKGGFLSGLTMKPQGFTVVLAGFLPTLAIIAMFPVVASIMEHFSSDPSAVVKVPAMVTSPGYSIALLAPFAGLVLDRFGRRRMFLFSTFFYGLVGALPFFLNDLDAVIGSRLLLGVCEAGVLTTVNTLLADYWDDRGRRNWLLLQGLCGPLLQPIIFFLVSLVATIRWNGGFLVYTIAMPLFIAGYFFIYEPRRESRLPSDEAARGTGAAFPLASAALVMSVTFLVALIYFVVIVFGSVAWKELGVVDPIQVSKYSSIPSLFILAGAVLFRLVARFSNTHQIACFLALFAVGLGGIGFANSVLQMQIAFAMQQTAAGMAVPVLIAWAQTKFSFEHRGRGIGGWTSSFFLGQAISPIVVGYVLVAAGTMQRTFQIIAVAAAVGTIIALVAGRAYASDRAAD